MKPHGGGVNEDPQSPVTEGQTPEEGTGSEEPADDIETPDTEPVKDSDADPVEDPDAESVEKPEEKPAEEPVEEAAEEPAEEPEDPAVDATDSAVSTVTGDETAAAETAQYTATAVVKIDGQEVTDLQNNEIISLELPEGKIPEGGSFTFKAAFREGKAAIYEFAKIAYTMGGREVDCTSTWESRGSQRTISNVTGDVTVIVEAAKRFQPKITFVNPENLAEITDIRINGETAEIGKLPAAEDIWELEAVEGSGVSFKITPKDFLKLDRVTYETEPSGRKATLSADKSGVYTITNLTENTEITVEASLDPTKSYGFVFTTSDSSRTAKMQVELPDAADGTPAEDFDGITREPHEDGETAYTRNDKILVSFLMEDEYKLGTVTVDGKEVAPQGDSGKYPVTLTMGKVAEISAETVADVHEEDLKIAFTVSGNSILKLTSVRDEEGEIKNENNIIYDPIRKGYYTLKKGKQKLFFDIESIYPSWKPVVNYYKEVEDVWYKEKLTLEPYASRVSDGKTIYSYRMTAKQLGEFREDEEWDDDENTKFWEVNFRVGYEVMDVKYSYSFTGADRDSLNNVNVSINGRTAGEVDQIRNEVTRNSQIPIRIWAKDGSSLNSVTYKVGNEEKTAKVAKNVAEFTVKVTDNTVITIDASGIPVAQPLKAVVTKDGVESEEEVAFAKNVYNVSYDGKYVARIAKGQPETQVYAKVTAVTLKKGNSEIKPQDDVVEVRENGTKVVVDLSKATDAIDGQKLILSLTAGGKSFSYPLQVSRKIAKVSDITAPASIKQPVGTTKYYKVTTKGEFDRLDVRLDKEENRKVISDVAFEKGQLKVTTAQTADTAVKADGVKIIVFSQEMPEVKKEIVVETISLLPANKPSVSLKSATDIDLTLAVSAATDADVDGAVYYKVEAKQSAGQTNVPDTLKKEVTAYFLKDGKSQNITINVGGTKIVEGEGGSTTEVPVEYGEGGACKFDVTVSLVHTNKAVTGQDGQVQEAASGIDSVTVVENGTNEKQIFKSARPFATQKAAWETNLKLKKGTTTVYTGQGEVQIAEAQFGKTTTYKVFDPKDKNAVKDVTENLGDSEKLEVTITQEGRIYATAKSGTRLGKHTVRVNAPTLSGMAASSTTVAVTVVRGIESIGVSVPAVSLYKGIHKTATLKASVVYNGDTTGKNKEKQPKTKKVEWELVAVTKDENGKYIKKTDTDEDGETKDVLFDSRVKIKNGTVTVPKDFEIAADDVKNTFIIRAAIDRRGKTKIGDDGAVGYSEPVTITNEGVVLYKLQLMKDGSSRLTGYKTSRTLEPEASQIDGAKLVVFDNKDQAVSWENLSVKSSRPKDVDIVTGDDGKPYLKIYKAKTNVVLTVTANDGSRQKLAIKIKPACENLMVWADNYWNEKKDLGLRFYTLLPDGENGEKNGEVIYSDEVNTVYDPDAKVQREASFAGTTRLRAKVVVIDTEESQEYDFDKDEWVRKPVTSVREGEFVDCTVKITGGVKSAETGRNIDFTASGKQVKVELSGKVTERKWDSKKRKNVDTFKTVKKVYTLDNLDVGTTTGVTAKALGSLHQSGTKAEQEAGIALKIPNAVAENLKGTGKSAVARVDLDWTKLNAKNSADLYQFMAHLSSGAKECAITELKPTADGKYQTAVIKLHFDQDMKLTQNSYALKVTAGTKTTVEEKEVFTPAAAAAAVTVKVDKPKKFTFKPTTSYTISTQESSVQLSGRATNILAEDLTTETYERLYNANIKGEVNCFTDYFEIVSKTDAGRITYQLALKDGVKPADISNKNDLTGFLQYTVDTDKTYYEKGAGTGTNIVKITVKLK